jgi:hypothetical protein
VSTSTTILGLAGAFGAGTVIATGLKSQLDRVEKFRDRQIEAAEEFLLAVAEVRRLQTSAVEGSISDRPPSEHWLAVYDTLVKDSQTKVEEVKRTLPRLRVIFNRGSVTGRLRRWPPVQDEIYSVTVELSMVRVLLVEFRAPLHDLPNPSGLRSIDADVWDVLVSARERADGAVEAATTALNRAIRRRWRV